MPRVSRRPRELASWFTKAHFETIFPYYKASSVFTHDTQPFWTYESFLVAVSWMNGHPNQMYHNFGMGSDNISTNMFEVAAFLGNFHQETGDPSIEAPYPWSWPKVEKRGEIWEGFAGGALGIMEGVIAQPFLGHVPAITAERIGKSLELGEVEKRVMGTPESTITGVLSVMSQLNQPQFGLGTGTGNGAVFQPGLVAVSSDGTLYGDEPVNETVGKVIPSSQLQRSTTDPRFAATGPYAQYGGRGAIQLSYNYNYSECSLALFGDYRLVRYPNLIITTDRQSFLGLPYYFGFPGPNPDGANVPPKWILDTTPPARIMAWLVCFWFWMDNKRSGRVISCHEAMMEPTKYGITTVNAIVNNSSGLQRGTWAWNKNIYYKRICKIFGLSDTETERTIVSPPHPLSLLKS